MTVPSNPPQQDETPVGEAPAPTKCPMCSGTLFNLYGLRCVRCGTRVVAFPGREIG